MIYYPSFTNSSGYVILPYKYLSNILRKLYIAGKENKVKLIFFIFCILHYESWCSLLLIMYKTMFVCIKKALFEETNRKIHVVKRYKWLESLETAIKAHANNSSWNKTWKQKHNLNVYISEWIRYVHIGFKYLKIQKFIRRSWLIIPPKELWRIRLLRYLLAYFSRIFRFLKVTIAENTRYFFAFIFLKRQQRVKWEITIYKMNITF